MNRGYAFLSFKDPVVKRQVLQAEKKHRVDGNALLVHVTRDI